jgi:hypothetical protein
MGKKIFSKQTSDTFGLFHRPTRDAEAAVNSEATDRVFAPIDKTQKPGSKKTKVALPKEVLAASELKDRKMPFHFVLPKDLNDALENPDEYDELADDIVDDLEKSEEYYSSEEDSYYDDDNSYDDENFDENKFDNDLDDIDDADEKNPAQTREMDENRDLLEKRFEKLVENYDDDQVGELDDTTKGNLQLENLTEMLDEFIETDAITYVTDSSLTRKLMEEQAAEKAAKKKNGRVTGTGRRR